MSTLSQKETRRVLAHLEEQGAQLVKTKSGFRVLFPNGDTTAIHWTTSDARATKNLRAVVRRAGLEWPTDHRRRTHMDPRRVESLAKLRAGLAKLPAEGFTTQDIIDASGLVTAPKVLPTLGYKAVRSPENPRAWVWQPVPPEAVEAEPEYPGIEYGKQVLEAQRATVEEPPLPDIVVQPKVAPKPEEREFIDSHDSWTIAVPPELAAMADTFNLNIECRVWRKEQS